MQMGKNGAVKLGGRYELSAPIVLEKNDRGLKIQAMDFKNPPRLIGGHLVKGFQVLQEKDVLAKLPAKARGKVLVADLKTQKIKDYGKWKPVGFGKGGTSAMELFVDGRRSTLARYPNLGWMTIKSIPKGKLGRTIVVKVNSDRLQRWSQESDSWLYGYWYHGWADRFLAVEKVDVSQKTLTLQDVQHYGLRKGQRVFARNLLCELDAPGEYYIDSRRGKIYSYPEKDGTFEAMVSTFESPILQINHTSGVEIVGVNVEVGRGSGISVKKSKSVTINGCHVRNLGEMGIVISGAEHWYLD